MKSLLLILLAALTYTNPVVFADYSDPDAIRVGNDYYMTSSSFNCYPGLQILHSTDLVNWKLVNAALPRAYAEEHGVEHGNFVWAPSLRYYDGEYFIFWGDPDRGIYYIHTSDILGAWSEPELLIEGKGYIDACPYWQGDTLYIAHALAGSRAGLKSVLLMATMQRSGKAWKLTDHRIIYDGHEANPTCEGPKIYERNGWYYIFTPAGGVATGWQLVLRSKSLYGPFEEKVVLAQQKTSVNGPHQGAWVTTPGGKDWFLHFQDIGSIGRIVHLQPMKWENDWPVIGENGIPVIRHEAPEGFKKQEQPTKIVFDFDSTALDFSWQYPHTPDVRWHYCDANKTTLRLYSVPTEKDAANLWNQPNILLRKIDAPSFTVTAEVHFSPSEKFTGERAGLVVMGLNYSGLMLENTADGIIAYQTVCRNANKGNQETHGAPIKITNSQWIYLRLTIKDSRAYYSISTDNNNFQNIGEPFILKEGVWIGAKYGFVCTRPALESLKTRNDGGWLDVYWMEIKY